MIVFENILTGETIGISRETEGKFYRAKLSAAINSSNMSVNADRGQDYGWRLSPEQQALIEEWEADPSMVDTVSKWSEVMVDALTHTEFLSYLLYQQEKGLSPETSDVAQRRASQQAYEARVAALRSGKPEPVAPFNPQIARGQETLEQFLSGELTGDASGDKEEDIEVTDESLAELDKVLAETDTTVPPVVETPVVGVDPATLGGDKTAVTPATPKTPKAKK